MDKLFTIASAVRLWPHVLCYLFKNNKEFKSDLDVWARRYMHGVPTGRMQRVYAVVWMMTFYQEFRNLFYYRFGKISKIFRFLCVPLPTLYVRSGNIGSGLFIQHGFATTIGAESIGSNCWINQQVTIGWVDSTGRPRIGNSVMVSAGAKVLGNITIGDNVKIGANAVVLRDVPPNCTVVGVPARIVRMNGVKVNKAL